MSYEELLREISKLDIELIEMDTPDLIKGLYVDGIIILKKDMLNVNKKCVLAEEIGHHLLNAGNILDQGDVSNRKQEKKARAWAYEKLIPLEKFVEAYFNGCYNFYDLVEFFEVTPEFLEDAISYYRQKYGNSVDESNFTISFSPLSVLKKYS